MINNTFIIATLCIIYKVTPRPVVTVVSFELFNCICSRGEINLKLVFFLKQNFNTSNL